MIIKNTKLFQAGGGRLLPKLVYGQDPTLLNILGTARATGYEQDIQNQQLQMQRDNNLDTQARFQQQFDYRKERDTIIDKQRQDQFIQQQKAADLQEKRFMLDVSDKYRELNTGMNVLPAQQDAINQLMLEKGIIDEEGNQKFDINTKDGLMNAYTAMAEVYVSPTFTNAVKLGTESTATKKRLDELASNIQKLKTSGNAFNFNTSEMDDELEALYGALIDVNTQINDEDKYKQLSEINARISAFDVPLSELGSEINNLSVEKAKVDILETKQSIRASEAQLEINELRAKGEYEKANALSKKYMQQGILSASKETDYDKKQKVIDNTTARLVADGVPYYEARNMAVQIEKGELGKVPSGSSSSSNKASKNDPYYKNIVYDTKGNIDPKATRLFTPTMGDVTIAELQANFGVSTGLGENVEDWNAKFSPYSSVNAGEKRIIKLDQMSGTGGQAKIVTNDPSVFGYLKGYGTDPGDWEMDADEVGEKYYNPETKMYSIPLSEVSQASGIENEPDELTKMTARALYDKTDKTFTQNASKAIAAYPTLLTEEKQDLIFSAIPIAENATGGYEDNKESFFNSAPETQALSLYLSGWLKQNQAHITGLARNEKRNNEVGGTEGSYHLTGGAMDIQSIENNESGRINELRMIQDLRERVETGGGLVRVNPKNPADITFNMPNSEDGTTVSFRLLYHDEHIHIENIIHKGTYGTKLK